MIIIWYRTHFVNTLSQLYGVEFVTQRLIRIQVGIFDFWLKHPNWINSGIRSFQTTNPNSMEWLNTRCIMMIWSIYVAYQFERLFTKNFKNEAISIFIFKANKNPEKVDFWNIVGPICTVYYIKCHPNSRFPNLPSFSRPKTVQVWRIYCTQEQRIHGYF